MTKFCRQHGDFPRGGRVAFGFTLVESVISIIIVGVMLVAALNVAGTSRRGDRFASDRTLGHLLAQELMNEILMTEYEDPDDTPVFGKETSEPPGAGRSVFDDVDDYNGWTSTRAKSKDDLSFLAPEGWTRSVVVERISPLDMVTVQTVETGIKRITVTVKHQEKIAAELVSIRTDAWPTELPESDATEVLMIVINKNFPTTQEQLRITMMESWGLQVTLASANASSGNLTSAAAGVMVVYISEEIDASELGTKLRETPVGVVNEEAELNNAFGFSSGQRSANKNKIRIFDSTHYIVSPFSIGDLVITDSLQPLVALGGFGPLGLQVLARTNTQGVNYYPSVSVHEVGADLYGGGTAEGRRVQLPWGGDNFDFNTLNADGQTIMRRAIEWAASDSLSVPIQTLKNPSAQ